jgi:uncharacterized NAD(P)/FAD-binding protein YdhS
MMCPECHAVDVPILVVRGSGVADDETVLQCRRCRNEWAADAVSITTCGRTGGPDRHARMTIRDGNISTR